MAVKSSGSLSMKTDIVGEFGGTAPHGLKEYYRDGSAGVTPNNTGVPTSGKIGFEDFYSAVLQFEHTITSNQKQLDLNTYLTGQGWNGSDPVVLTINSGVWIWSDSTSVAGLTISNAFNGILDITNNGNIIGKGGAGATVTTYAVNAAGQAGGAAISNAATGVTLTNGSGAYIAGGGGGGGSGRMAGGGGGAGGGAGGNGIGYGSGGGTGQNGGLGGAIGQAGTGGGTTSGTAPKYETGTPSNALNWGGSDGGSGDRGGHGGGAGGGGAAGIDTGSSNGLHGGGGGGGGRILSGTGGNGADRSGPSRPSGREGGDGGSAGNAGDIGLGSYGGEDGAGGGGGWGAAGGAGALTSNGNGGAGGAGGAAISGTSISVTNNGTIYGSQA